MTDLLKTAATCVLAAILAMVSLFGAALIIAWVVSQL